MKAKNMRLCIALIVGLIFISGCVSDTHKVDLAICGSYGVPGMLCSDLKGGTYECVVLEEDSQGRIMYTYTTQSFITEKKEQAVVICQKREKNAVYYYEDVCYLLSEWTTNDLELLKEKNDWNKPLDSNKMVGRSNRTTFDNYIYLNETLEYSQVKRVCCDELNVTQEQITDLCFLDTNEKMELYWLAITRSSAEECYFVLVDQDYNSVYLTVDRTLHALDGLPTFKKNNGW